MKKRDSIVLVFVMVLAACQKDAAYSPDQGGNSSGTAHQEEFTTFAATQGSTRTSMRADGLFSWTAGDKIHVQTAPGTFKQPTSTIITSTQTDAQFNFTGTFSKYSYPVRYTGNGNSNPSQVTIPSKQLQTAANNADHFGTSGDCGVATATRNGDHYDFTLQHKASYLVLNPVTASEPMVDYCYLLSVTVTDLSSNTLCGTYTFDENGLSSSPTSDGSSTITLELEKDRQTPVDNYSSSPYWKDVTGDIKDMEANFHLNKAGLNTAYIVIQPGTHQLRVTYRVAYFRLQDTEYDVVWKFKFDDNVKDYAVDYSISDYEPGYFYTMRPTLDLSPQEPRFQYNYSGYHQWDASGSYWDFLTTDPTTDSQVPRNNNETVTVLQSAVSGSTSFTPRNDYNPSGYLVAQNTPFSDITPNVNEMTWYIMAGDVHRDEETLWWMHGYHNQYTLCKEGVWILKKAYISGYSATQTYDAGDGALDLTQGDRPAEAVLDKFSKGFLTVGLDDHKHRPSDTEIYKYFFLPDRGYYQTSWKSATEFDLQLKLMGAEGFYWTSTAIKDYQEGSNKKRHAYALEIKDRETIPCIRLKYKDQTSEHVMRRYGFIAGYRPYTDPKEPWFQ